MGFFWLLYIKLFLLNKFLQILLSLELFRKVCDVYGGRLSDLMTYSVNAKLCCVNRFYNFHRYIRNHCRYHFSDLAFWNLLRNCFNV